MVEGFLQLFPVSVHSKPFAPCLRLQWSPPPLPGSFSRSTECFWHPHFLLSALFILSPLFSMLPNTSSILGTEGAVLYYSSPSLQKPTGARELKARAGAFCRLLFLPHHPSYFKLHTEDGSHGINMYFIEPQTGLGRKGLKDHLVPTLCHRQGHLPLSPGCPRPHSPWPWTLPGMRRPQLLWAT